MKHERLQKAESITKKLIAEYLATEARELSLEYWIITVTDVKISPDLSYLDVFVSSIWKHDWVTKALSEHAHPLHRMLGRKINFIKVPKIRFRYDESWEISFDITQTLSNLDIK